MFIRHLDFNCASRYQRRQRQVKLEECVKVGYAHSPPRRGGVDAPKAQTGWSDRLKRFAELTTPALRATPPLRGGEWQCKLPFQLPPHKILCRGALPWLKRRKPSPLIAGIS